MCKNKNHVRAYIHERHTYKQRKIYTQHVRYMDDDDDDDDDNDDDDDDDDSFTRDRSM